MGFRNNPGPVLEPVDYGIQNPEYYSPKQTAQRKIIYNLTIKIPVFFSIVFCEIKFIIYLTNVTLVGLT